MPMRAMTEIQMAENLTVLPIRVSLEREEEERSALRAGAI